MQYCVFPSRLATGRGAQSGETGAQLCVVLVGLARECARSKVLPSGEASAKSECQLVCGKKCVYAWGFALCGICRRRALHCALCALWTVFRRLQSARNAFYALSNACSVHTSRQSRRVGETTNAKQMQLAHSAPEMKIDRGPKLERLNWKDARLCNLFMLIESELQLGPLGSLSLWQASLVAGPPGESLGRPVLRSQSSPRNRLARPIVPEAIIGLLVVDVARPLQTNWLPSSADCLL